MLLPLSRKDAASAAKHVLLVTGRNRLDVAGVADSGPASTEASYNGSVSHELRWSLTSSAGRIESERPQTRWDIGFHRFTDSFQSENTSNCIDPAEPNVPERSSFRAARVEHAVTCDSRAQFP